MTNKYHRQGFSAAGFVTKTLSKAATKAAEKIKKIDKKDIINFSGAYKKRVKALRSLNKPAVDEYKKSVKEIFSRVTKGKSKEELINKEEDIDIEVKHKRNVKEKESNNNIMTMKF